MSKQIKVTSRGRTVVYGEDDKAPFWLEHLAALIVTGLVVIVGGVVVLSLTDGGRATLVWLGLGLGLVMAVWLSIDPWRSWRRGEPAAVWIGEALSAFGWSGMTALLAAGIPYVFWRGPDSLPPGWQVVIPVGTVAFIATTFLGLRLQTSRPLPALDRTPRSARVILASEDSEGAQTIAVRYRGVDGKKHDADLADLIDDSWLDRFAPDSTWQVYAFRNPQLANAVVFLTEAHDDVWRDGYKLDGVRLGGEGGPVRPGPGSPFLREDSKWRFEL
ncbi:hypothetical protein ACFWHT_08195 [Microbacterium sp. NPDC058342]|uniref:hypothetical protein n=1 Tax=Microbacterium sp. NPDC058342 TaxID=3346454 RepID=UPI00365E35FE